MSTPKQASIPEGLKYIESLLPEDRRGLRPAFEVFSAALPVAQSLGAGPQDVVEVLANMIGGIVAENWPDGQDEEAERWLKKVNQIIVGRFRIARMGEPEGTA